MQQWRRLKGTAKQQYVADLFSRIARRYDLMNDLMTAGLHRRWKGQTAQLTAQGLAGKALDVATGTGDLALALSKRPGIDCVVGVDLLPEMATLARHKTAAGNRGAHLGLLLGDALRLPFADGSFACVTAGFSLRNMPDLDRALAEMARGGAARRAGNHSRVDPTAARTPIQVDSMVFPPADAV